MEGIEIEVEIKTTAVFSEASLHALKMYYPTKNGSLHPSAETSV